MMACKDSGSVRSYCVMKIWLALAVVLSIGRAWKPVSLATFESRAVPAKISTKSKSSTHLPENFVIPQLGFCKCCETCCSTGWYETSSTWSIEWHTIGFSPVLFTFFVKASFACSSLLFKKSRCETVLLSPSQLVRHVTRLWFVRWHLIQQCFPFLHLPLLSYKKQLRCINAGIRHLYLCIYIYTYGYKWGIRKYAGK